MLATAAHHPSSMLDFPGWSQRNEKMQEQIQSTSPASVMYLFCAHRVLVNVISCNSPCWLLYEVYVIVPTTNCKS